MKKLTLSDIELKIEKIEFARFGATLTICVLTLKNGFNVVGKSACISEEFFDEKIGEKMAYDDAVKHIWELEGYALKSQTGK